MQVYCGGPMSNEAERQLRDTSDAVMRDLEALSALEEEKRALHPGDPRLLDFATRIRSLADRLLKVSADEQARDESSCRCVQRLAEHSPCSGQVTIG